MNTRNQSQQPGQRPKPAQASSEACGVRSWWEGWQRERALRLHKLDKAMRETRSQAQAVRAGFLFLIVAVHMRAVDELNALGDLLPDTQLSERSLDRVFEEGEVTDEILALVLAKADAEPDFNSSLLLEFGASCIEDWRANLAQRAKQGVLL